MSKILLDHPSRLRMQTERRNEATSSLRRTYTHPHRILCESEILLNHPSCLRMQPEQRKRATGPHNPPQHCPICVQYERTYLDASSMYLTPRLAHWAKYLRVLRILQPLRCLPCVLYPCRRVLHDSTCRNASKTHVKVPSAPHVDLLHLLPHVLCPLHCVLHEPTRIYMPESLLNYCCPPWTVDRIRAAARNFCGVGLTQRPLCSR